MIQWGTQGLAAPGGSGWPSLPLKRPHLIPCRLDLAPDAISLVHIDLALPGQGREHILLQTDGAGTRPQATGVLPGEREERWPKLLAELNGEGAWSP